MSEKDLAVFDDIEKIADEVSRALTSRKMGDITNAEFEHKFTTGFRRLSKLAHLGRQWIIDRERVMADMRAVRAANTELSAELNKAAARFQVLENAIGGKEVAESYLSAAVLEEAHKAIGSLLEDAKARAEAERKAK